MKTHLKEIMTPLEDLVTVNLYLVRWGIDVTIRGALSS
jgi:hypothetical protein